jgi:hypothetical protein
VLASAVKHRCGGEWPITHSLELFGSMQRDVGCAAVSAIIKAQGDKRRAPNCSNGRIDADTVQPGLRAWALASDQRQPARSISARSSAANDAFTYE